MTVHITLEKGPETKSDVLVNVFCEGQRAGTIALSKAVWAEIEQRGRVDVYVASKLEVDR